MNLKKGDRVLCVENKSTVRPLVIESTDGGKVLFSKQLDKGIKKTFGLKEGSFQLIKPRYISEHEKKEYINPELNRHDRVKVIHVDGIDENNLLGRNATVIAIKENNKGDREVWLWVDGLSSNADSKTPNPVPYILELERRTASNASAIMWKNAPKGELVQKSLVLKLDEPQGKQEDYIDDVLHLPEQTEEKKQKISPDLEVGDRIMAWDIEHILDFPGEGDNPSTFLATVQKVIDYDAEWENAIRYLVKLEDTDEVIGLYGGEVIRKPSVDGEFTYEGRDKWLKLPKIGITEDTDIFGQGLLDPIEPEEFEGEEEEWDELVGDVEDDEFVVEPEYAYKGGKTDPETGFVAPSAEVTDNICKVKGFCDAQGPITFGQLKALVEEATKKRISADIGRGVFKSLWRIIPFFIPQVLLASVGVTVTRAFNKIITPSLQNTGGYKSWWGKVVLKAMDVAEGDYIPDVALGDDPLSKIFFISDGLLQMIRDKYKLKFARYVAEVASVMGDDKPVPEWFVENLLRDYLNQKFLLDPPLEPKEGTDFQMVMEHEEERDPEDGIQTREPFTKTEAQILNYLAKEFTWEELNTISSIDETQIMGDLEKKWVSHIKLFGEYPNQQDDSWIRSSRWAKWAVENWEEAKVEMDGGGYSQDFKKVTTPIKSWPSWFEVDGNESYWQKEYRSGTIELGAYDREDAEERADESWWEYDPDMEHYDYGDTDDHEIEMADVRYMKALNEHKKSKISPDLDEGDTIRVIEVDGEHANMPEVWGIYKVHDVRQDNATQELYYELSGETSEIVPDTTFSTTRLTNSKYLYPGDTWIPADVPMATKVDRKTISEHQKTKVSPELEVDDIIRVIELEADGYKWEGQTKRPETFDVYRVLGKEGFAKYDGSRSRYDLIKLPASKETRHRIYTIYVGDTWIYADEPTATGLDRETISEHAGDRDMKGFTPKFIGYLKFIFETNEILTDHDLIRVDLFNIAEWEVKSLYLILRYNLTEVSSDNTIKDMLNNMPIEDYVIPQVWEYEFQYYGDYEQSQDEEECDDTSGVGESSGEDCECEHGVKYVEDKDGYEEEEDCDFEQDDDCECVEWWRKEYDIYYNMMCNRIVYSTTKLDKTHEGSDEAYGYHQMYEIDNELNDGNSVVEDESCDPDYDDGQTWEYFHERDDEIIGLDTDKWPTSQLPNLLERINNKIYGIKPLIDIIEDQYDVMSDKDTKMKDLTSQIFDILDDNFDMFEHPEGEIEYDGKNMGLYSHHNDSFVPFEHIYNPIIQMLEGGIQQEDIEVFVEIITNWVNYVMSEKREYLNEEVNIKSDDSNYSKEDYENFVDFAHKELNIDDDCPIDVEAEKSTEYTTGNYHINDRKIKVLDNGRKLADILRTIAHELVHHKQNELGMLVGEIPEIGGKIEDQANAYAGRLVKKYGKQTPNLYTESRIDIISEEKVVGFNNPNNNFVVIAGGPGAGKSFITKNLVNLDNVKEFNVDQVRVMTAKKLWGDEWEEKISTEEGYDEILRRTFTTSDPRNLTVKFLKQFLQAERDQPVNVIYDAGGGQEQVMKDIHQLAKENGFETTLVHVRTPLDIAQERNIERPRSLPPEMVAQYHQQVRDNMRNMIPIFDNVWSVDNKELIDLANRPTDNIEKLK